MATLKTANKKGKYKDFEARNTLIHYILQPAKVVQNYFGGYGVAPEAPAESMEQVAAQFGKSDGVQLRHYIISFSPAELQNPHTAFLIAQDIAKYIGQEYQSVFAVHGDTPNLHIHFIVNTISYIDGRRWGGTKAEFYRLKTAMQNILLRYNIHSFRYASAVS